MNKSKNEHGWAQTNAQTGRNHRVGTFLPLHSYYTDGLAIFLLNLLLAFLQPKFDPSLQEDLVADKIEEGRTGELESG